MRVLFVDDDEGVSQSVETALRRKGHAVDTANLGSDALELMEDAAYDVVVLDVGLPDMDGYHIVRRMKIDQIATPVVMQTGLAGQDLKEDAETLGIKGLLAKPFSIHELLECLDSVFADPDPAGQDPEVPPRAAPEPEQQSTPQQGLEPSPPSGPPVQPSVSPDPAGPPPQTVSASGRALRHALMDDNAPAVNAGPQVRPAPPRAADPRSPLVSDVSAEPAVEPTAKQASQAAPAEPPEPPPEPVSAAQPASSIQAAPPVPQDAEEDDDDERRNFKRKPTVEAALITDEGKLLACVIMDLSDGGARVKLADAQRSCPNTFTLKPLDGPERRCEVRWRSNEYVGLKFI